MSVTRRRFLTIAAAAALAPSAAASAPVTWRGFAMGAEVSVTLAVPAHSAAALFQQVEAKLRLVESLFSLYDPSSHLSRLNREGWLDRPPAEMQAVLDLCDRIYRATEGRFDPTIQPLWQAAATDGDLDAAAGLVGWHRVQCARDRVQLSPGQALTLNGIAQGFATDMVAELLVQAGLTKVLVNIGEFTGVGGPWRIGVADPVYGLVTERSLQNSAIATSSPAAMRLASGQSHILDPRHSGKPLPWSTVSVEADTAATADAVSTALCLVPRGQVQQILDRLPEVRSAICVSKSGAVEVFQSA